MEGGEGFHGEDNDVRAGQEEMGFEEIGVVSDKSSRAAMVCMAQRVSDTSTTDMICFRQILLASRSFIVSTPLCFQYQSEFYFVQFKTRWLSHVHSRRHATNSIAKKLISVMWPSASKLSAHMFEIFLVEYVDTLILSLVCQYFIPRQNTLSMPVGTISYPV